MSLDPYKTLGVDKKADAAAIKTAYRRLARQYHPDVNPGDGAAEEKFKEISEAYDILSDEEKRREYDSLGRKAFYERGFGGAGYQRPDFNGAGFSFEEIFGDLFSGARMDRRGFHFGGSGPRPGPRPGRGGDLYCGLAIGLKEAALGTEAALDLNQPQVCPDCQGQGLLAAGGGVRPCPTCRGQGQVTRPQSLKVKIPAGLNSGQKIRLKGQGAPGLGGGPPGDLLVEVTVRPDPVFTRQGRDLEAELPVSLYEMLLGGKVSVPTLSGRASLKVPAGTQNGTRMRLKGQGLPATSREKAGDLYVALKAVLPIRLDDEAVSLAERLAQAAPVAVAQESLK
jgi:DnaJ-class molecular chaperone